MKANKFVYDYTTEAYLWSKHIPDGINYMSAPDPVALFDMMMYKELDKWSYVTDNSKETMDSFQGVSTTFGYSLVFGRFSNAQDQYFAVVQYVYPDSPAQKAGLKRGDFILTLGGATLNATNYTQLYYGSTITLGLGERNAEGAIGLSGKSVTMTAVKMYEDPVVDYSVISTDGKKIGYLFYAGFYADSHSKLADVFSYFQGEQVTDLILDLRYNLGGDAKTPSYLASLFAPYNIVKEKSVFLTQTWNDLYMDYFKSTGADMNTYFHPDIPVNLNLSRVYVLTTGSTASASEATISGLTPYMDVIKVGEKSYGKYCGAALITPKDASGKDDLEISNWLLSLVIYKFVNTQGFTEFKDGIAPDYEVSDSGLMAGIPLGDPDDPMVARVLQLITGSATKAPAVKMPAGVEVIPHLGEDVTRGGMKSIVNL
jgi:C-terminal processing protease CtpA/Prc